MIVKVIRIIEQSVDAVTYILHDQFAQMEKTYIDVHEATSADCILG